MIQRGGTVTYNKIWIPKRTQEYSILEADLLNKLNVTPINVDDKYFVYGLDSWWFNYNRKGPMTESLTTIISKLNTHDLPEYSSTLNDIIIRREQDLEKIGKTKGNNKATHGHTNYINSLKVARKLFQDLYKFRNNNGKSDDKKLSANRTPSISPPNPQLLRSPSTDPNPIFVENLWFLHQYSGYNAWINKYTGEEAFAIFNETTQFYDFQPI